MTHAAIVGWGKCLPPLILTNQDLATFLPTDDEWITTRTGMKERRISHVPGIELAITAARRAVACAGMSGKDIELVIYGSCSNDELVPNSASGVQQRIGATPGCEGNYRARMLDPDHATKSARLEGALRAVGKRLLLAIDDAA